MSGLYNDEDNNDQSQASPDEKRCYTKKWGDCMLIKSNVQDQVFIKSKQSKLKHYW